MKLSFRRAKSTKKIAATDPTMDDVIEPRRNFFRSSGGKERAMSYSGPSMLTNVRPHEGGAGAHASRIKHRRPRPDKQAPQQGQQRGDDNQEDGDEDDDDSCDGNSEGEAPAVIVLRRSTREIAEMQELLDHRELMMERRLSLPAEHPRSNLYDEMIQAKNQEGSSELEKRDRTDSIE